MPSMMTILSPFRVMMGLAIGFLTVKMKTSLIIATLLYTFMMEISLRKY
ncbi:hypothetical protein FPV33_13385 [Klebsiella aerogenes]|uniref:Uncharacterized protein n=1 Tax=Klebsiella aerogenes (strain ATCC 13048 / DSM 30053 / CCUG 1429 / JCM 1235 / KCTC 2190 / NBRC 13534 / NCIMB 10102 / NCTC 10006 / CDC 819-56) TaxID=1028307 RepID=A0A0H3FW58_KLEAK|nr:hypothetical protein EAE_18300 [Klebsiella aerogenes KCTC 2190]AUY89209.1 hypothetical protein AL497_26045 [Klebsiella aerogenes]AUZ17035.1 hypothetical protein AL511_26535 [Klebsiella aerogenes]AVF00500.1 hypothetical protein AM441_18460 [Klebsiella aerogenes]AWD04883.1 hypothetical protein AM407_18525 [Klebsiella aerogenes]